MAVVKRVWFANAPSAAVDNLQRSELGIGYSFILDSPVIIIIIPVNFLSYIRRYLNDNDTLDTSFPTYAARPLSPVSTFLTYLRSYLGDQ